MMPLGADALRMEIAWLSLNEVFGGDPNVFWGFTSATGGARNLHQVCYGYTTFLDGFEDVVICPGGQFQIKLSGGVKYHWTPETGLSNPNIANPVAAIWTASMMLEHLGEPAAAQRLMRAVEAVTARGEVMSPDLGGTATTEQVTDAVIAALSGANM